MGKFGRKNEVDLNPLHYNICLLGEGGIGKTTIIKQVCEKLVGEDGYIHLDIGREDGAAAIQGIVSEQIEDWAKLKEVTEDIIENKTTDYPDLQVLIYDSFDAIPITKNYILQLHKILYSHMNNPIAGKTKIVQNYISATYPDGHVETLFTPLNPIDTPIALENICIEYNRVIGENRV